MKMDEITDDKSLVAALKKAHQDTKDLDYKVREKRLDEAVSLAVKKAFDLMGFDGVFQTYRRIEEANGGETFTSEIFDNDARDSLESAVTELAIERKSEMTEKQRHNLFETNILYRGLSVSRSKTLADNLGLQLTPERLKLIQEGLVRNSKMKFWKK